MSPETLEAFKAHAAAEYPRECCGWIVVVKGRERYWPSANLASDPTERCRWDHEELEAAELAGEILAMCHSHPDTAARPSEADLVMCEQSGLPWLIAAVHAGTVVEVHRFEPTGYQAPLVGRMFHHGVLDCYTLVRDWHAREAGIVLPDFPRADNWWNDGRSSLYLDHFREAGCEVVTANIREHREPLRRGDIILMQIRSGNDVPNHAAVFIDEGFNRMLHHLPNRLSSRDVYGGMWVEYTRLVVRHRDLPP